MNEAILDPPDPVKLLATSMRSTNEPFLLRGDYPNDQPTESWVIKSFEPLSFRVICYTAITHWNKCLFGCLLSLRWWNCFNSLQTKVELSKMTSQSSIPHQQSDFPTGLGNSSQHMCWEARREPDATTRNTRFTKLTCYFFDFQEKMKGGGWERKKQHQCSPFPNSKDNFFFLALIFLFSYLYWPPVTHQSCYMDNF